MVVSHASHLQDLYIPQAKRLGFGPCHEETIGALDTYKLLDGREAFVL